MTTVEHGKTAVDDRKLFLLGMTEYLVVIIWNGQYFTILGIVVVQVSINAAASIIVTTSLPTYIKQRDPSSV